MSTKFDNIERIDTTRYELAVDAIIQMLKNYTERKI